ncbi:regucalcin-like [Pecten maximus]|uniref:regucalcin-like n=1 Tax=Pecten maximus TaxID=6579 RepID=UPI001457E789|nr:regucalcin-like [Pecten maximus]
MKLIQKALTTDSTTANATLLGGSGQELWVARSTKRLSSSRTLVVFTALTSMFSIMFYTDTGTRKVEAFTYDVTSGEISDRRDAVNFNNFPDKDAMGWPDGMTIDTDDPVTGTKLREVNIPAPRTTSCCFGGKHMDELYVTTATLRALEDELNKYPLCGSVFKVTELGVKGYPAANVYRSIATSGL